MGSGVVGSATSRRFFHRWATATDIPVISAIMDAAISELQRNYLTAVQITASRELMGLDTRLIDDGTYLVIESVRESGCESGEETGRQDVGEIVGCGGWSKRKTLFGGNHTSGRDATLLDPARDAAPVRAMYTRPDWTRQGIGRLIVELCETAAREAGFSRTQLMATLSGEPLYLACGYRPKERLDVGTSRGITVPLIRMEKAL